MNRLSQLTFVFVVLLAAACGQPEGFKKPEDALDAGREFVRSVLNGDYKKAELYIMPDEEDIRLFLRFRDYMKQRPQDEISGLKESSITINKVEEISDSVTIINYSNSFEKKPTEIKVVKKDDQWWVDFSYTFSGNLPIE